MAHRRKHRRHRRARENPLEDSTKIFIAVGVTAAVVGVGYYLYKRSQAAPSAALPTNATPQLASATSGQGGVQSTPPVNAPQGGSTPDAGPPVAVNQVMATRAIAPAPVAPPTSIHAPRTRSGTSMLNPMFTAP